jgi:glycogen debranching enzyme
MVTTKRNPLILSLGAASWLSLLAVGQGPAAAGTGSSASNLHGHNLKIERRVAVGEPFTVAGPHGVLVGQQEGTFEAWLLPVKLLSHFTLRAEVDKYPVPIELNPDAAEIDVQPDHTTITYSHIALTVRQTMFAPAETPEGTGAVVLFSIDSVHPVTLTFSFTPEMRPMWPEPGGGSPSAEWVKDPGAYILHTDSPDLAGAVEIPSALPGIMAPYQEKPQVHPLEFKLRYDPAVDRGRVYPLLMAVGQTKASASNAALLSGLAALDKTLTASYLKNVERFAAMEQTLTSIQTPDAYFDEAFKWAEISIEQLRADSQPGETGLVAGYYSSGDSARPGFGWFFGRDALYALYAVNGMGDFALTRASLEFLMARQRSDGKMMHEFSQTAGAVNWKALPYMYAAADATPLFLMAMQDYVQASGDVAFLKKHRENVEKAWEFESSQDSDADGVYDNVQGTGWVESWPGGQPHQEIYLALLDQQASAAMGRLGALLGDKALSDAAVSRANKLRQTIEEEYYLPTTGKYAFSRNANGSLDRTSTLFPSIAWWSGEPGLAHPDKSFREWDSHDFSTDWGTRDVAESDPVYDPISYHQGSVWPLFTGWAALADYRSGHSLSGYKHLRQNFQQTSTQDPGAITELLSGAYFQPFGRSTSHQLWSSAMVITPALRGLFGLTVDAAHHTVAVVPQLPADWPGAQVKNLHIGDSVCTLTFKRVRDGLEVSSVTSTGEPVKVSWMKQTGNSVIVALPPVEVSMPQQLPLPGARTSQPKVLEEKRGPLSLTLVVEGQAGSNVEMLVRASSSLKLTASGATLTYRPDGLRVAHVVFGPGQGYVSTTVVFNW